VHALLSILLFVGTAGSPKCRPDALHPPLAQRYRMYRVRAPKALLLLAAATSPKDRARGLMEVPVMPACFGMIFKFTGDDSPRAFWMKNTLIPLDMVFVRANGTVSSVAANVPATTHATPDEKIPRRYGTGQFVLELNAGEAARDGLAPGVRLVLPKVEAL
jgi:uncharacterized membrane protein (UPF0127 family)